MNASLGSGAVGSGRSGEYPSGDARMSYMGMDSARSSIDETARFGAQPRSPGVQQPVPNFGAARAPEQVARFGAMAPVQEGRASTQLAEVEGLGTTDLSQQSAPLTARGESRESYDQAPNSARLPSQYELATPVIMQEITQNLRKTMVGLSNEVKARENEDWRLEQGFTQLDSRRELMCVQLHTRYEQTKNELENMGKQIIELQGHAGDMDGR